VIKRPLLAVPAPVALTQNEWPLNPRKLPARIFTL
jgi:hypothetical protein